MLLTEGDLVRGVALSTTRVPALYSTGGNLLSLGGCYRLTMPHLEGLLCLFNPYNGPQ